MQVLDFGQAVSERPGPALAACLLGVTPEAADGVRDAAVDRAVAQGTLAAADAMLARDLVSVAAGGGCSLAAIDHGRRDP